MKPTHLCTDASRWGLGFILQQHHNDKWALIQASLRFLSDTESRYAIIELELLAVTWAIKCKVFLASLPHFIVLTDHRLDEIENPLKRKSWDIPSQLSGLREPSIMPWMHCPGVQYQTHSQMNYLWRVQCHQPRSSYKRPTWQPKTSWPVWYSRTRLGIPTA